MRKESVRQVAGRDERFAVRRQLRSSELDAPVGELRVPPRSA